MLVIRDRTMCRCIRVDYLRVDTSEAESDHLYVSKSTAFSEGSGRIHRLAREISVQPRGVIRKTIEPFAILGATSRLQTELLNRVSVSRILGKVL